MPINFPSLALILLLSLAGPVVAKECEPLIYTQQPRHTTPVKADPADPRQFDIDDGANWQLTTDIGNVWRTTEHDVMHQAADCTVTTLYNCTTSEEVCAAQEARMSPDGKRVAFTLFTAPKDAPKIPVKAENGPMISGLWTFDPTDSDIWICEIGGECWNATEGEKGRHRQPDWASNDLLVFASTRAGTYPPMSTQGRNFYQFPATQLWRAALDKGQLVDWYNLTPDQYFVMTPEVMSNGLICYSSWHGEAPREFGSTPQNQWWLDCRDINGKAMNHALLGAHGSPTLKTWDLVRDILDPLRRGEGSTKIKGLRGIGELWADYIAVGSYYRSNSIGPNGVTLGFEANWDAEGCSRQSDMIGSQYKSSEQGSGQFAPCTLQVLTPWAQDQDQSLPKYHKNGRATGRSGNPFALPDKDGKRWGSTTSRGWCYRVAGPGMATVKAMGGEPTCKKQINENLVLQVLDPFDEKQTRCIAGCDLDVHAFDAQYAGPYSDLYGIPAPAIAKIKPPAEECFLQVVNAKQGELDENPTNRNRTPEKRKELRVAFQGNSVHQDELPEKLKYFGVDTFDHWDRVPTKEGPAKATGTYFAQIQEDGSVRLKVPCGAPFFHFGYDKGLNKIARGISPLSAGETLTCLGCHGGHSERRAAELLKKGTPEQQFEKTQAAKSADDTKYVPVGC
jgi:hypothetical protein